MRPARLIGERDFARPPQSDASTPVGGFNGFSQNWGMKPASCQLDFGKFTTSLDCTDAVALLLSRMEQQREHGRYTLSGGPSDSRPGFARSQLSDRELR